MKTENQLKKDFFEEDRAAIEASIKGLSQHRQGRKFLWWLLEIGGVGKQPHSNNALQTAFNCGVLDVGQQILAEVIDTEPEVYPKMMKENVDEHRERAARLRDARKPADPGPGI